MFRTSLRAIPVLVVALSLTGSPVLAADKQQRLPKTMHVLTVGVGWLAGQQKDGRSCGADQDARDVAAFFKGQEGKIARHVRAETLVNEMATHDNILDALDRLRSEFRAGDTAVVYLRGHGGDRGGQWHMCPHDGPWGRGDRSRRLTEHELRQRLEDLPGRVVLLLESCHSGAFGIGGEGRVDPQPTSLVVYAAAQPEQYSYFGAPTYKDSAKVPGLGLAGAGEITLPGKGWFTEALLDALCGKADRNGDGVVTLAEVDAYVSASIAARVEGYTEWKAYGLTELRQTTCLRKPATVSDDLVLASQRPAANEAAATDSTATEAPGTKAGGVPGAERGFLIFQILILCVPGGFLLIAVGNLLAAILRRLVAAGRRAAQDNGVVTGLPQLGSEGAGS
jgi:hypothetical protein